MNYCGHLYYENKWNEKGKEYIMICHDHMVKNKTIEWTPSMTITHFFIREVWYWWAAQQSLIIKEWDKQKH